MSQKLKNSFLNSVSFKLTLWFSIIFIVFCLVVFSTAYFTLKFRLDKQIDDSLTEKMLEMEIIYNEGGFERLETEMKTEPASAGFDKEFFLITTTNAELLATTDLQFWPGIQPIRPLIVKAPRDKCLIKTVDIPYHNHKVRVATQKIAENIVVQIGRCLSDNDKLLSIFTDVILISIFLLLPLCVFFSRVISKQAMNGVIRVTNAASKIAAGDFSHRVDVKSNGTEIINLATVFNRMIDKIQILINELKDVANNIAHDLKTPVTRIRGIAETTLSGDDSIESYREMAGTIIEECDSMTSLINTVLDISEADAGLNDMDKEKFDFVNLVSTAYELFKSLSDEKHISFSFSCQEKYIFVSGNKMKLQRVVANLIDNAVKYTPAHGKINIQLSKSQGSVIFKIQNSGAGISEKNLNNIFKRFFREDKSRTTSGNGLGLSLAEAIVKAHNGTISVESSANNYTIFTVTLPV